MYPSINYTFELDTNFFNENIFKMCTDCGVFAHDFSDMFCKCGLKLHYVDVSDIEALKNWLKFLSLDEPVLYEPEMGELGELEPVDETLEPEFLEDTHLCYNGEDCSNPDCLDCQEQHWDDSQSHSEATSVYYQALVNDKIACGPNCGPNCDCDCDCEDSDYDDYDDQDSVS
jgi:hypothetical protein